MIRVSRSYKKTPICKTISKGAKTFSNRKVRKSSELKNGRHYRRVYQQASVWEFRHYLSPSNRVKYSRK